MAQSGRARILTGFATVIDYDRTSWWRTCLALHGTVIPRILGRVGALTAFCLALCLVDEYVLAPAGHPLPALDQLGHTVLGMALGMLIVFRTNSSYTRYWDARTFWGAIINNSRNLMRVASAHAAPADEFVRLLLAYVRALKQSLRGSGDLSELQSFLPAAVYEKICSSGSPAVIASKAMSEWVVARTADGRLDPLVAVEMEQLIDKLLDAQGACERIQKTPMPFVYVVLIRQLLLLYLVSLPFALIAKMHFAAPLVIAVVALGMFGIEEAGVEIEDPFGLEPNNLPLGRFCNTIARDAAAILEADQPEVVEQ